MADQTDVCTSMDREKHTGRQVTKQGTVYDHLHRTSSATNPGCVSYCSSKIGLVQVLNKDDATLWQAQLCPAAKLYFGCSKQSGPFLKPEVLALRAAPPQPAAPSGNSSTL